MSIIYVMIPLALALVGVAVWALVWAIRSGQFDELESHGWTPVLDDDERPRQGDDDQRTRQENDDPPPQPGSDDQRPQVRDDGEARPRTDSDGPEAP